MNKFLSYLQEQFNYSDYQIQLLRFFFTALIYETSKIILMGIFFAVVDCLVEYFLATLVLMLLRSYSGGLHFRSYAACFAFTIAFYIACILILPCVYVSKTIMLVLLFLCMLTTHYFAPIVSKTRPTPKGIVIKHCKRNSSFIIFIYTLITFIIPLNHYISIGFWVIILQTLQLVFAHIIKQRRNDNENQIN